MEALTAQSSVTASRVSHSNEAHGYDFNLAHAVNFGHAGFEDIGKARSIVHLDVHLHETKTEGEGFDFDGLDIVYLVRETTNGLGDGVGI
ncbi:MAG: hypothetical protein VX845_05065, partial [Candidatus Thermoplasmatota archaeon]|nr:hypothetical protein [Candidatus Thermoplasmatota archaeon]